MQDFKSPFYVANRVGRKGVNFRMIKVRSMIVNAENSGVVSTSSNDQRITKVGRIIRKFKIDELCQFWNVLIGNMSMVGPRPNVLSEVELYSKEELKLLDVKPGITDFSSIVFADLNELLGKSKNPNLDYNQLVRPWKSRLGLVYVENQSLWLYIQLIFFTFMESVNRNYVLIRINSILSKLNVSEEVLDVCTRKKPLYPAIPPGLDEIVTSR